jgi:hypothetical protein
MGLNQVEAQPAVGDYRIKVCHYIVFCHNWETRKVFLREPVGIEIAQTLSMPTRPLQSDSQESGKLQLSLGLQTLGRPHDVLQVLRDECHRLGKVSCSQGLVVSLHVAHRSLKPSSSGRPFHRGRAL